MRVRYPKLKAPYNKSDGLGKGGPGDLPDLNQVQREVKFRVKENLESAESTF